MTQNIDSLFSTNEAAEESGVWIDVTDTIKFKIRAYSAKAVIDLRDELTKPFRAMIRAGAEIPAEKDKEIGRKVIAGAVIADWAGIVDANGAEIAYSAAEAEATLKRLPKMLNFIIGISTDQQFYKDKLDETSEKN